MDKKMAMNFSPAKIFSGIRTPTQPSGSSSNELDTWFTPVRSPRPPNRGSEDEYSDGAVEEMVRKLREHNADLHSHHLTSVIAGLGSQHMFSLKPEDFKPAMPTVIAPVTMKDFQDFLVNTRGRTQRLLGRKKSQELPRGRTGSSSGLTDSTGRSIFDFREPLEQWQDEAAISPQESLDQCYSQVPEIFFSDNFDAVNDAPEVLLLIDRTTDIRHQREHDPNYDTANLEMEITNMKDDMASHLSEHLDLVEKCLFTQTTTKADTIFSTVTNLHSLQSMVALESGRVAGLRKHVADLRAVTTTGRAQVLSLQRKRSNAVALLKTLEAIKTVTLARGAMDKLLQANDYTGAYAILDQALSTLEGELNGVIALRTLARQFRELKDVIGGEMADTFVRVATDRLDATSTIFAHANSINGNSAAAEELARFRASLGPLVRGMINKGNLRDALAKHRGRLLDLVKNTAKLVVAQTLENIPIERRSDVLREMPVVEFVSFLRATFEGLEIILARAELVHNAVIASLPNPTAPSVQTRSARKGTMYAPQQQQQQQHLQSYGLQLTAEELTDLKNSSAAVVLKVRESAHAVINRLLVFRDEQHAMLSLSDFKLIYDCVQDFVDSTGEATPELKQVLLKQCNAILTHLDEKNVSELRQLMDTESWEVVSAIPKEVQSIVARIESGKVVLNEMQVEDGIRVGSRESEAEMQARRHLSVGARNIKVTSVAIAMIRMVNDYIRCAIMFPSIAYLSAQKCFDLCLVYDERIRRLILGADVMRLGRLQKVGSKHLAMASQSITAIMLLLHPLCRFFVEAVPPQQQAKIEEDMMKRAERTMRDHVNQITETLVSLITSSLHELHMAIDRVQWDSISPTGLDTESKYMKEFCEDKVARLHGVLSTHLDKVSLEEVFQGVKPQPGMKGVEGIFSKINQQVPQFFANVNPKSPAGQMRIRVDISYLVSSLRQLRGSGPGFGPGSTLEDWVNTKYGRPIG